MLWAAMKTLFAFLPILAATLLASSALEAEVSPELQSQLEEIRELLKPADTDTPEVKSWKARMKSLPANLQNTINQGQLSSLSQYTADSLGEASGIPGLAEKMDGLRRAAQQEVIQQNRTEIERGEAQLKEVGELLQTAKKPEELDALLAELGNQRFSDNQGSPQLATLHRQIQAATQIVGNWQEYLMAKEAGNFDAQRSNLQQVSSALSSCPVLPRSTVLRLLNLSAVPAEHQSTTPPAESPKSAIDSIAEALTQSGDVKEAITQFDILSARHPTVKDHSMLQTLQTIENLRMLEPSMAESEVIAHVRTLNQSLANRLIYNRALDQIVLNSVARNYPIEAPSAKITTPRKVVEGLAEATVKNQNWPLLRRAISTLENLSYGSNGNLESMKRATDLKLISLFEIAQAAEARSDVEAATTAYVEASPLEGFYISRAHAYSKLADLKQKSPDKLEPLLAKAEERKQQAEAARYAAELEARDRIQRSMMAPGSFGRSGTSPARSEIKALVQEVVAEFLKEKRLEAAQKPADASGKPEELPNPKTEAPIPGKK